MTPLQAFIVKGDIDKESAMGSPQITFNGQSYIAIPSVNEFKRDLDTGGFRVDKMLTMTIRLLDTDGNPLYPFIPDAQDIISYNGESFRIETKKMHPIGTYVRYVAMCTARGV